jgi:catalase (peroxidase I)
LIGTSIIAEEAKADYDKIRKQIAAVIDADPNRGPTLIRLAWHASGTYSKVDKTGGSDGGNIRHQPEAGHGANAGLHLARGWLEPIKKSNPGITYADLFTLAGVVAIEEMGGPKIKWRPGRSDNPDGKSSSQNTRLPDADKGKNVDTIKHIREIFNRMGFSDQEIVALLGAHSLGRCYTDRSGYSGPWTKAPTAFSNEYYRELLENTWTVKKWKGPLQYEDKAKELMMLPADMALLSDGEFKKWVEIYAKDEARFSKDFAAAFGKLLELGVKSFEKKGWWPF